MRASKPAGDRALRRVGFALAFGLAFGSAGIVRAQPGFSASFDPATVGPGSTSTLEFVIDNTATLVPIDDLDFTNVLPAGVVIADPSGLSTTCIDGILSGPAGGTTIALTQGRIAGFWRCTVSVNVVAPPPGGYTNVSGDLTSTPGNSGAAVTNLTVDALLPGFSATLLPSPITRDQTTTLTFTIDNSDAGAVDQLGLTFSDLLPAGLHVASPARAVSDCGTANTPPFITAEPGSQQLRFNVNGSGAFPAVAAGATCTFSVDVTATAAGILEYASRPMSAGDFSTSAPIGKATTSVEVVLLPLHQLFVGDPVREGETVELQFTITNFNRADAATNIDFSENLGSVMFGLQAVGLPLVDPCGPGSQLSGTDVLTFTDGHVDKASSDDVSSCTFSVTLDVPLPTAPGDYVFTTNTPTFEVGGQPATWPAVADTLTIEAAPTLLFTKEFIDDPVAQGGQATLRFTITNTGGDDATAIGFSDTWDSILPGLTATELADGFCGPGSDMNPLPVGFPFFALQMSGGSVPAGTDCTFDLIIDVPADAPGGPHLNETTELSATVAGAQVTVPPATDFLRVAYAPVLARSFTDDPVAPGGAVTLEYTLSHNVLASGDATAIAFTDDLATTLTGLTATGLPMSDVCGTGSSLAGSAGDTLLTLADGTLTPDGTCTFSLTLDVPAAASPGAKFGTTSNVTATVGGAAVASGGASDDLLITGFNTRKSFTDDPVYPGGTVTLEYTLENVSTASITNIAFEESLGGIMRNLGLAGPLPPTPCGATSTFVGGDPIRLNGGELAAGTSCTFSVALNVPGAARVDTYNSVTSPVAALVDGTPTSFDPIRDQLLVGSPFVFGKRFTDDPVAPGDTVTLGFTLANADTVNDATGLTFTDDLDAVLPGLVASGTLPTNPCGVGSTLTGTSVLTLTNGTLPPAGVCTFEVTLTVPANVTSGGAFTNVTSPLDGTVGGLPVSTGPAVDRLQINMYRFDKSFAAATIPGGTVNLSFDIENLDSATAVSGLELSDDLDAMLAGAAVGGLPRTDVCGDGSQLTGTSSIALTRGALAAASTCTFDVDVQIPGAATPGSYDNVSSTLTAGGGLAGVPATATLYVAPAPPFTQIFVPAFILPGDTSTVTFTVDNTGSAAALDGLDFGNTLPAELTLATPANGSTTCTGGTVTAADGGGVISYSGGTVAAGASCTLQADVIGSTLGVHINSTGDLTVAGGTVAGSSATLTVEGPPSVAMVFAPTSVDEGGISTLTLTIDNTGIMLGATALDFTDNLPAGMVLATPANGATTCTGGTVTAADGASVLSYTGGSVAADSSCEVSCDVVGETVGRLRNTTDAVTSSNGNSGTASAPLTVRSVSTADSCGAGHDVCDANATCVDVGGTYECQCAFGFIGNGRTCVGGGTPDGGCNCSADGGGAANGLMIVLLLAGLWVRRRRD